MKIISLSLGRYLRGDAGAQHQRTEGTGTFVHCDDGQLHLILLFWSWVEFEQTFTSLLFANTMSQKMYAFKLAVRERANNYIAIVYKMHACIVLRCMAVYITVMIKSQ